MIPENEVPYLEIQEDAAPIATERELHNECGPLEPVSENVSLFDRNNRFL